MTACDRGITRILALAATAAVLLAGCGGSGGGGDTDTSEPSGSSSATDAQAPPDQLVIDVMIKGGTVTPTNAELRATVGAPIVIHVDSDAPDQLHVHSTPEHAFDVGIGPAQTFQFTVDIPSRVDVELHELNKTVATIQVQ